MSLNTSTKMVFYIGSGGHATSALEPT